MGSEDAERHELRFVTSAAASADARALANVGLARIDLLVDVAALVFAGAAIALGFVLLGIAVAVVAILPLLGSVSHPFQRALIAWRFGSLLGKPTTVTMDGEGVRFENEVASTFVPWSSVTDVRSSSRTVALFRDRVLLGYVPASAFASPQAQARVVAFARARATRLS